MSHDFSDQAPADAGYALVVFWRARPGQVDAVAALLRELAASVMTEPGAVAFNVHRDPADDHAFVLYELYRSEAAFQAHRATTHFKTLVLEKAVPLLERRDLHHLAPMFELPSAG